MSFLDLSILNLESISLAADATKDGSSVPAQVQSLGELASRVTKESNLLDISS